MATMIGNFNDGSARGKMQFGSAWWFLDQKDGWKKQLNALSNMGLLSLFYRHADGQPQFSVVSTARIFPPPVVQPARQRRAPRRTT
ncbi:MAG: glucuronate isomerase [Saprospiraceae bacterium]